MYRNVLVKTYLNYFNNIYFLCKNFWGGVTAQPRFDFVTSASHKCDFTLVYFTTDSIRGKTNLYFHPSMEEFIKEEDGKQINCAWMDENSAIYSSEYLCEYHPRKRWPIKISWI